MGAGIYAGPARCGAGLHKTADGITDVFCEEPRDFDIFGADVPIGATWTCPRCGATTTDSAGSLRASAVAGSAEAGGAESLELKSRRLDSAVPRRVP